MNLRWRTLDRYTDLGLLIVRAGLGAMFFLYHGWPKLIGGPDEWRNIGRAVSYFGLHGGFVVCGFIAMLIECAGGICLALGWATRPVALAFTVEMVVAAAWRYYPFGGWSAAAHPFELAIVFLGLVFLGPGKHSFDASI